MKRILLVGLLALGTISTASAQCNGVFPNNTLCGNVTGSSNLPRPTSPSAFLGAAGGTNGQIQYNNSGALGGFGPITGDISLTVPGAVSTIQPNAVTTTKIIDGAITSAKILNNTILNADLAANAIPVLPSRAIAATLDLSAYTAVHTLGYTTAGDGGGATFTKVVGVPFKDTYILTGTIAGGSGYTNGTYLGVPMGGGVGIGCMARVIVSGGAVTTVDLSGVFCNAYAVGNVLIPLTSAIGGTGSGATFTVATISTPTGSFTDSAGNLWQYIVSEGGIPNSAQFGMKLDWDGSDGSATNNLSGFNSAMAFMSTTFGSSSAIVNGGTFLMRKGAGMFCASPAQFATLQVPNGVEILGSGEYGGTSLRQCSAANASEHFVALCDPNSQFGQFGCRLRNIALKTPGGTSAGVAAVYSNSGQQFPLLENVYIEPSGRLCVKYEIGKGGASNAIFNNVDCERVDSSTNVGFSGNSSGTQIVLQNWVFGCAPGNCANGVYAINMIAGNFIMETVHVEQHVSPVNVATTVASQLSVARGWSITTGCVNGFTLQASNANGNFMLENVESSCSNATVLNGHGSGTNLTGNRQLQIIFAP